MDPNLVAILAVALGAVAITLLAALLLSGALRQYGVRGAVRRRFSNTYRKSHF